MSLVNISDCYLIPDKMKPQQAEDKVTLTKAILMAVAVVLIYFCIRTVVKAPILAPVSDAVSVITSRSFQVEGKLLIDMVLAFS